MKSAFSNFFNAVVQEFWAKILIDWNYRGWFSELLEYLDEWLTDKNYPPIFVRYKDESGCLGDWVLSDYYPELGIEFNWRGHIKNLKARVYVPTSDPRFSEFCDSLHVGYPTAGLFMCEEDIDQWVEVNP